MADHKITFKGHSGADLSARFDRPAGPQQATAIFAHCFTCSKDIPAARRIAGRLAAMGIGVLRFDFTGLGHSGGEFGNTGFSGQVGDIEAAADYLKDQGMAPTLLIGHSLGGAAVLAATGRIDGIRAVATLGAPFDPAHALGHFSAALDQIRRDGKGEVSLAGRSFTISREFLDDVSKSSLGQTLRKLKAALLVMHAPRDEVVSIDNASAIFLAARHPKSFVTLDTADHLISDPEAAEYAAGVIAAWAGRYLDIRPPAPPPGAPEGIVRTSEADAAGFLQDISAGPRHHLLADEPVSYGGSDQGLSPYQLLAAGLGACTSMTIRMYARRKKWPLGHVEVDVSHDKVHAEDCEDCEGKGGKIDRFTRLIRLTGDLSDDQRSRLLEIADKCPVHRTLETANRIETSLAAD
ncbi:MAG: OsmC family protein [Rhodobacteraceae bacterium]|nr:OsmC family protein [Paracoccaceae bacterium]